MGLCDSPDKVIKKAVKASRRRRGHFNKSASSGRNAGHRHRGKPKAEFGPVDWVVHQPADMVTIPAPSQTFTLAQPVLDEMWDTHGYLQKWYNPCVKEKLVSGVSPYPDISDSDGPLLTFGETVISPRDYIRATVPFLSEVQIDELMLRSEQKLKSVVDTEVSLVNFIIELIQVCEGNVKAITKFGNIYKKVLERFQTELARLLKNKVKYASAKWLAWNFAIKPFIKDLQAILCGINHAYKKMAWLQRHNHKVVYLDYHRSDLADQVSFDPTEYIDAGPLFQILKADPNGVPPNGFYYMQVRYYDYELQYHARSKNYLDIPEKYLEGMVGIQTLWSAMQGFHNPVGIVWEAIPFSWLVDYFLSYRARLFQSIFDYNPYNRAVTNLGYGHSYTLKVKCHPRIAYRHTVDGEEVIDEWYSYGATSYELYTRTEGLPKAGQSTLFRLPTSWYQLSIIGALGVGIHPGRRRS